MEPQGFDRAKFDDIFSRGLCNGMGEVDGQMCIESAIALACGEELNDKPVCVHPVVRAHAIRLNDAQWSSPEARALNLRNYAIAQLGTANKLDGVEFARRLALATIRELLPITLRLVKLEKEALACEAAVDLPTAEAAAELAAAAAEAAADAPLILAAQIAARILREMR